MVVAGSVGSHVAQELVKNVVLKGVSSVLLVSLPTAGDSAGGDGDGGCIFPREAGDESDAAAVVRHARLLNPLVAVDVLAAGDAGVDVLAQHIAGAAQDTAAPCTVLAVVGHVGVAAAAVLDNACRARGGCPFVWVVCDASVSFMFTDFGAHYVYAAGGSSATLHFDSLADVWQTHHQRARDMQPAWEGGPRSRKGGAVASVSPLLHAVQRVLDADSSAIQTDAFDRQPGAPACRGGGGGSDALPRRQCPAVAAIMAGIVAQEAIKGITHKDMPIHNVALFDGRAIHASSVVSVAVPQVPQ